MSTVAISKKDEIIVKLTHYFITKENYTPIVIRGAKDEIWLENTEGPYRIIRINSNHVHNNEQYHFDLIKMKSIMKQIKRKTYSFSINVLNIFLDLNDDINIYEEKNINSIEIKSVKDIKNNNILKNTFPQIDDLLLKNVDGLDLVLNVTKDINKKTEEENKKIEKIFSPKKTIITHVIISLNIIMFLLMYIFGKGSTDIGTLLAFGANYGPLFRSGEVYRIITAAFLHCGILHLFLNMYALYILGTQLENYIGSKRFAIVYLGSAITGNLLSNVLNTSVGVGASGAIFGLLGSLLYFGYYYRFQLGDSIKNQILPVILINLFLGLLITNIDIFNHIGGLIGGFLLSMSVGVSEKVSKSDRINGTIAYLIYIAFMIFMIFIVMAK